MQCNCRIMQKAKSPYLRKNQCGFFNSILTCHELICLCNPKRPTPESLTRLSGVIFFCFRSSALSKSGTTRFNTKAINWHFDFDVILTRLLLFLYSNPKRPTPESFNPSLRGYFFALEAPRSAKVVPHDLMQQRQIGVCI